MVTKETLEANRKEIDRLLKEEIEENLKLSADEHLERARRAIEGSMKRRKSLQKALERVLQ
ncbi:MAG: hypothetical protein ACUVTD_07130 [Nitrososphaerales archaeon]